MQTHHAQKTGSPWLSSRLLTPHLTVKNVADSKHFYTEVFGFQVRHENLKEGVPVHVEMSYHNELAIMFVPENVANSGTLAPASFTDAKQRTAYQYIYVNNVDATVKRAQALGATVLQQPYDAPWGDRFTLMVDINGYHWGIAQTHEPGFPTF
ncbi:VOC family protein [Chania multitudinisentens]|uniref:VOC family protein n=1 Tax=Chania multitudinisentens TaxID=1639108 RepID=UPI0004B2D1BB|nr:VOC family protein [Chania multitudinisentens]